MKKNLLIYLFCFLLISSLFSAKIDDDLNEMLTGTTFLVEDFKTVASFLSGELGKLVIYSSTSGNYTPANVCAFPGIAIGATFGATISKFNIDGMKSLSLDYLPEEDLAQKLPTSLAIWVLNPYLKTGIIGLPVFKADIGVRYLPLKFNIKAKDTSLDYQNYIFGIDIRGQILEDSLLSPLGLLAILSIDFISGHFYLTNTQKSKERVNINSTDYDLEISGTNRWNIDWNIRSIGLKLIANKTIAFFGPFAGIGINLNTGNLNGGVGLDANVTLKDIPPLSGIATAKTGLIGTSSREPQSLDFRLLGGFELGIIPFTKLNLAFEWGGEIYSATGGLKIQIP